MYARGQINGSIDMLAEPINGGISSANIGGGPTGDPPAPMGIALMVSGFERDHIDALRARSYELAVARGHMRRN
ncbi:MULTISPECIES: hypothetical protein [unclassified Cryobacterium]|uniref:hypothetical protein n=1 Tax=unclassified Cryobacterium TaxID=2649013 RepID=UPI00106D5FD3|nr:MULTISPECIES: hypothetical protein [unclassified Cryobacterium]TFC59414.1 hypothetical protein E3O68_00500 [Cryobacterium sp. TMB3-1-2]TFC67210.1 hypothetical protein E3T21_17195 [Cryobacterium sp. TMB3-15]TFC73277.1 hypothetical protein E3T22_16860 [Cryobacterium sp. TMB3-10]TFD46165.1 hypothetical protein E3T58_01495 [Cryobacterium sp. TMB3-12]